MLKILEGVWPASLRKGRLFQSRISACFRPFSDLKWCPSFLLLPSITDNDSRKSLWQSSGHAKAPTPPASLKKSKRGNNRTKHSLVNDHDQPPNGSQRNKDICLGFVAFISLLTFSLLIYTLVELHSLSVHHDALNDEISRIKLATELVRKSVKRQGVDYNLMNMGETALR